MRIALSIRSTLLILGMLVSAAASFAQVRVGISVTIAPPELPVYDQPICPGDGFLWTPGYWAYGDDDYYWVPGTWVEAPEVGFLWTPGYWGWREGGYFFTDGYWGPQIGFYGGINYGFGYFGHGFEGGRWDNGHFFYNRAVANVDVTVIRNVYETRVNETNVTRVSFNGGNGGVSVRATSQEESAAQGRHIPAVAAQTQHIEAARSNPELRASANHGKPPIAATARPGELKGSGVVAAREGGTVHEPAARTENNNARPENSNAARPNNVVHPNDIPRGDRPPAPGTGNPNLDKKYQQQQDKLQAQQDKERQSLQQKQDQDHQKLAQQKANDAQKQQVEQRHQQQTQQLQQKHVQQQQQMQQRQQQAPREAPSRPPKG